MAYVFSCKGCQVRTVSLEYFSSLILGLPICLSQDVVSCDMYLFC